MCEEEGQEPMTGESSVSERVSERARNLTNTAHHYYYCRKRWVGGVTPEILQSLTKTKTARCCQHHSVLSRSPTAPNTYSCISSTHCVFMSLTLLLFHRFLYHYVVVKVISQISFNITVNDYYVHVTGHLNSC